MKLTPVITVLIMMFTGTELSAQMTSLDTFAPIAFTKFQSSMPDEKASPIVESLTRNLRSTIVDVYATEMIGSTSEYSPMLPPAILGSTGFAIGEIDKTVELKVLPEIKPVLGTLTDGEKIIFDLEFLWADNDTLSQLPGASLATNALVSVLRLSGRQDAASLLAMRWLDIDEYDRSGSMRSRLRSTVMLRRMMAAHKDQWIPWLTNIKVVIDRDGIRIDQDGLLVPSGFHKPNRVEKPGVLIERVTYAPLHFPTYPDGHSRGSDMARLTFKRYYAAEGANQASDLRLAFGQWDESGFKMVKGAQAANAVERVPTIHGRVVFAESTWWDSVMGWLRSWFVSDINVKILLQDLSITYDRDSHRVSVDPAKSIIPIVVTTNDLFSGGKPYVLDPRVGVFGINLYERFVGSQIADGLSADLNKTLSAADAALSQLIVGIAGRVVN